MDGELTETLVDLVDQYGLTNIVSTLSSICALHAQSASDLSQHSLADGWARVAERLSALARYTRPFSTFTK